MKLSNGCIAPNYINIRSTALVNKPKDFFNEMYISMGEITAVYPPTDKNNVSKRHTEYEVTVWRRYGQGPQELLTYHCYHTDSLGGIADKVRYSYRSHTGKLKGKDLNNGSLVLIACLNGDRTLAYIIGGIPNVNAPATDNDKTGRYLDFRFNGVEIGIHDDGSFSFSVSGATLTDGTPDPNRDSNNKGSKVTIAADGAITIDDNSGENVVIDPSSKSISVNSGQNWTLTSPNVTVISDNVQIGADSLTLEDNAVVIGKGIDTFTGATYFELHNTSLTVKSNE